MTRRLIRCARATAGFAVFLAHFTLAMAAGTAAGSYAWRHGYTVPGDTSDTALITCAVLTGLLTTAAVLTLPEGLVTRLRYAVWGRPLVRCTACGSIAPPLEADNDRKQTLTHPAEKEITQ